MPQVSVVIPVYNIEAHLRQCLDSVAGQTLSDLEVICVDDGSTDTSPAILEEYAQKDPRFQVVRQANAGPGAARNRGMERSLGPVSHLSGLGRLVRAGLSGAHDGPGGRDRRGRDHLPLRRV